jgi:hypothetical protein
MIKLKDILQEIIYGNQAIVYHRSQADDLAKRIYDTGFIPGEGLSLGKGMYSVLNLEDTDTETGMGSMYGNTIVKFSVDLTGFFFFDWDEFIKTPLYKQKIARSTKETFIQDQIQYYNIVMTKELSSFDKKVSNELETYILKNSDLTDKVSGIVYDNRPYSGPHLCCYDTKRLRPLAFKKDGEAVFTKVNSTKDFINKTSLYTK